MIVLSKPTTSSGKTKEIKIVTKQIITLDDILNDPRKIKLLYIISEFGGLSEKALQHLIYEMKLKEYDLKYDFTLVGKIPSSKELLNDLLALKYTDLVETTSSKKITISSRGKEFLEKYGDKISSEEKENIKKLVEELRVKIKPLDLEVEMKFRKARGRRI